MLRKGFIRNNRNKYNGVFVLAICVVLICACVSKWCYQVILIQGESMYPSYNSGEFALIDKHKRVFNRDDVIAFEKNDIRGLLVKRIVAIPGDYVQIKDGVLLVNGKIGIMNPNQAIEDAGCVDAEIKLDKDEYFVLGDNYAISKDSRSDVIGVVHKNQIKGLLIPQKSIVLIQM